MNLEEFITLSNIATSLVGIMAALTLIVAFLAARDAREKKNHQ